MTYWLQISSVDHDICLKEYLVKRQLKVMHNRVEIDINNSHFTTLCDGMALKHVSGVQVRIMTRKYNNANLSYDFLLCSNRIDYETKKLVHEL